MPLTDSSLSVDVVGPYREHPPRLCKALSCRRQAQLEARSTTDNDHVRSPDWCNHDNRPHRKTCPPSARPMFGAISTVPLEWCAMVK
jgi:hypothetical protein